MFKIDSIDGIGKISSDTIVLRVFKKEKYEKLFVDNSIWFSNIDYLIEKCDPLERTIPESFYKRMPDFQEDYYKKCNAIKDKNYKTFVSCWSKKECKKLWETYDPLSNGFAIVSTVSKLLDAFNRDSSMVLACEVLYVDLNDKNVSLDLPWIITKNEEKDMHHIFRLKEKYKAGEFIEDDEIRFIGFDELTENNSKGINVKVELSELIDGVIINPYSDKETTKYLKNMIEEKHLNILSSSLE